MILDFPRQFAAKIRLLVEKNYPYTILYLSVYVV